MKEDKCDPEVYENGTFIMTTHTVPKPVLNEWVKASSDSCGVKIDWHYVGGRAVVKALGDPSRAKQALREHREIHDEGYRSYWLDNADSNWPERAMKKLIKKEIENIWLNVW